MPKITDFTRTFVRNIFKISERMYKIDKDAGKAEYRK